MPETTQAVSKDRFARLAEQVPLLSDAAEEVVQDAVQSVYRSMGSSGPKVRNLVHGTWLNEPLHVIMTDIPTGSWTGTVAFDALAAMGAGRKMDFAADATLVLGLLGAVGSAVTGMSDWSEIKRQPARRIGSVHAVLNIAATGLFGASWWSRRRSSTRGQGRALAALGFLLVSASAHLGGNMIYEHGVGVGAEKFEPRTEI